MKRLSRRQLLVWSVCGVGGAALAACTPKATITAPTQAPAAKATAVPATPAPKAPITLTVINQDAFGDKTWEEIYSAFEAEHPGIKVTRGLVPWTDIEPKVLTQLAGGVPLDVPMTFHMNTNTFALKGAILPIEEQFANQPIPESDYYPTLGLYKWRGHLWGLPYQNSPGIFGYNPKAFQEAGLKTPTELLKEGKWNIQIYHEYAEKLSKGEGVNRQYGTQNFGQTSIRVTPSMWVWGYGGDVWNETETETLIASPQAIEAWEVQASYVHKDWAPTADEVQGISGAALWDKVVMGIPARWTLKLAAEGGTLANCRMVPWFTFPSGKASVRDGQNGFSVSSTSKHKQEAWEFVRWNADVGHKMLIKMFWATPLRKSLMTDKVFTDTINPLFEDADTYRIANENVRVLSHVPRITEIDSRIRAAFDLVILKQKSAKDAMQEIKAPIDEILKETANTPLPKASWN
jgi:multiple sugar transport system substrate-binding protein